MSATTLRMPVDIPWRRLAFSPDMIDTSFGDLELPPKWRSSLVAFYHLVPVEDSAEDYPEGRIVYLRLSCSVTGFNPNEDLRQAATIGREGDNPSDAQYATWDAILAEDWASTYWPCLGAIAQLAVYPHPSDQATPEGFPFIVDVEPKKRELYETRTDTGEVLSGSSEKLNVSKSNSMSEATEKSHIVSGEVNASLFGIGASGGYQYTTKKSSEAETIDTRTSDAARERRETTSHSTTISQMYQLFNAYHLGTNRTVFAIAPRPHVVTSTQQAPFNLIRGRRVLEGIQDVFAVVYVPNGLKGFSLQATLDTGHEVSWLDNAPLVVSRKDLPDTSDPRPGGGFRRPEIVVASDGAVDPPVSQLVVTRRVIRACGLFDLDVGLILTPAPPTPTAARVVFEALVERAPPSSTVAPVTRGTLATEGNPLARTADQLNAAQARIQAAILRGVSAGGYAPRALTETRTFRRLATLVLQRQQLPTRGLVADTRLAAVLAKAGVNTVADLFGVARKVKGISDAQLLEARRHVLDHLLAPRRDREPPQVP